MELLWGLIIIFGFIGTMFLIGFVSSRFKTSYQFPLPTEGRRKGTWIAAAQSRNFFGDTFNEGHFICEVEEVRQLGRRSRVVFLGISDEGGRPISNPKGWMRLAPQWLETANVQWES